MSILDTLKQHHLSEMYLSLPVEHKQSWQQYLPKSCNCRDCSSGSTKPFPVKSTARLLWVTAANAIPHYKYEFAEILLNKALDLSEHDDDKLWIHANLAQLYYDQIDDSDTAAKKCRHHCDTLYQMGFFTSWLKQISEDLNKSDDLTKSE